MEPRLREVEGRAWSDDYEAAVAEYFATGSRPGWEPARDAATRMRAALDELEQGDGDVCAVSHGLVLSLYVAALADRPPDLATWRAMPFPAVAVVEAGTATRFLSLDEFLPD